MLIRSTIVALAGNYIIYAVQKSEPVIKTFLF